MKDTRKQMQIFLYLLLLTMVVGSQVFGNSVDGVTMDGDTEEPLGGVTVYLRPESGGGRVYQTISDNSGNYRFGFVAVGTYLLSASKTGYETYTAEGPLDVVAGTPISGQDILLMPGSGGGGMTFVEGAVIDENTEAPLGGVRVYLRPDGGVGQRYQAVSNRAGNYRIDNVAEGAYILSASRAGYEPYTEAEPLDIMAGTPISGQDILLMPGGVTGINEGGMGHLPGEIALYQNSPNPFNPTTRISFFLPNSQTVRLSVYNVLGQVVKEIMNSNLPAGKHVMEWNGTDLNGQQVSSGIYLYILEHDNHSLVRKMLLAR